MQEGTSIGLMTVLTIVGFGILFGLLFVFMPELQAATLSILEGSVNNSPIPK